MKRLFCCLLLSLCLLLSGCSLLDGREVSITPHELQAQTVRQEGISAENYLDLMKALSEMISAGEGEGVIEISRYDSAEVDGGMELAIRYAMEDHPIGNYAVEDIRYEIGTVGGMPALAVNITYDRTQSQIQRIRSMDNLVEAEAAILSALEGYDSSIVLLVDHYVKTDIAQAVEDYALEHPQSIMETPHVTVDVYGKGIRRVMEVGFVYQNSREDLRQMEEQVAPVFDAAKLYVSGEGSVWQKYSQLYSFLMERFSYTIATSITPSYSLLRHGVGDSRAFATVFAEMCRSAGLECLVVNGTCEGQARTWNMIRIGNRYFHLDLLRCRRLNRYRLFTDEDMEDYIWDYSRYPKAEAYEDDETEEPVILPEPTEPPETEPTEPPTEPEPSETTEPTTPETTVPPTESQKPTEPGETTGPPKPTEPEETTGPTKPTEPEETTDPTEPADPEETVKPTQPVRPTWPTRPTDPSKPTGTTPAEMAGETQQD